MPKAKQKPKPKGPSTEEINAQIEALREIKPTVRQISICGDNHHDAIDAQIRTLEERWSEDDMHTEADDESWEDNVRDAAREASEWLSGEYVDYSSLVDSWRELVVGKPK